MNERNETMAGLYLHAKAAKLQIELVMSILEWPRDEALSRAIDRLVILMELSGNPGRKVNMEDNFGGEQKAS